jgi:hypothetical protein
MPYSKVNTVLLTCFNKQKLSCIRLILSRLKRTVSDRLITTVSNWASRRRKGWHETDLLTLLNVLM